MYCKKIIKYNTIHDWKRIIQFRNICEWKKFWNLINFYCLFYNEFFFCTTIKCKKSFFLMWGCELKTNSGNKWNKYLRNETGNGNFFICWTGNFSLLFYFCWKKFYNCVWNEYVIRWTISVSWNWCWFPFR